MSLIQPILRTNRAILSFRAPVPLIESRWLLCILRAHIQKLRERSELGINRRRPRCLPIILSSLLIINPQIIFWTPIRILRGSFQGRCHIQLRLHRAVLILGRLHGLPHDLILFFDHGAPYVCRHAWAFEVLQPLCKAFAFLDKRLDMADVARLKSQFTFFLMMSKTG